MNSPNRMILNFLSLLLPVIAFAQQPKQKTILFVCEHGSAKSIVAASHFRKMAKQEGLDIKVISRGTNPDKAVPEKVNQFLVQDGFEKHLAVPERLSADDIRDADYVVAFSPLPAALGQPHRLEAWSIPSFEAGYPAARDSITANIQRIIQRIKSDTQK
jgi:arsenate reductase (thioredoxin)